MAHRIQELLNEQGYRPATFAKKAGVPQSTFAEILSGKRDFNKVGVSKIIAIAKGFGVTVEYLSGEPGAAKYPKDGMAEKLDMLFSMLNEDGQSRLLELADDMVLCGKYKKKGVQDYSISDFDEAAIA